VYSDVLPGAKHLTPLNFIRCGLADAIETEEGNQLHKGAKYGVNWRPKSKEELGRRATVITQAFKGTAAKDGIYEILVDIFGPLFAREFCQREDCNYPLGLTNCHNNRPHTPGTHDRRATAPPPLLNTSRHAPRRLEQPTPPLLNTSRHAPRQLEQLAPHQSRIIITPRGMRAMEPNANPRPLGPPTPLQGQSQVITPRGVRAIEPNSLAKGLAFERLTNPASRSVHSQPGLVVTANTGRMSSPRLNAFVKGKRKASPSESGRGNSVRRLV
jgi:hypothetical protein